jgi:hypothetical protein
MLRRPIEPTTQSVKSQGAVGPDGGGAEKPNGINSDEY